MAISELTGKEIPAELLKERGRLVDAIADSQAHIHGKASRSTAIRTSATA